METADLWPMGGLDFTVKGGTPYAYFAENAAHGMCSAVSGDVLPR